MRIRIRKTVSRSGLGGNWCSIKKTVPRVASARSRLEVFLGKSARVCFAVCGSLARISGCDRVASTLASLLQATT